MAGNSLAQQPVQQPIPPLAAQQLQQSYIDAGRVPARPFRPQASTGQAGNAGSILGNLAQPQQATFSIPEDFQQQIRQIRQQQVGQVFQDRFGYPLGSPPPPAAQQRLLNLLQQYYPGSQTPVGINFALGNAFTPATFPTAPQRLSPPIQLSLGQPKIAPGQPPLTPSIIQALKQAYARRGIPQR